MEAFGDPIVLGKAPHAGDLLPPGPEGPGELLKGLQAADSATGVSWTLLEDNIQGTGTTNMVQDPDPVIRRVYRVECQYP